MKPKPKQQPRRGWIVGSVVFVAAGAAGVWAWSEFGRTPEPNGSLPAEFSVEALKAQATDPMALREKVRNADLTDEQRRELGNNMRSVWQSMMQERVDEYFNAPDDQKDAVLDRHLDEFAQRMKEWEQRRKEHEREGQNNEEERQRWRDAMRNRSKQERKEDSESRNPDDMARGMAYFSAMRQRAEARGMQMPGPGGRGGPGSGGPGGGRGPGGGGRP